MDIEEMLQPLPLFRKLDEATLRSFCDASQLVQHSKGKVLFLQEDEAQYFYVIVQGWVKLFRETIEGTEAVVDVLTKGHSFGENSAFEHNLYSYGAECVEHSQLISIPTTLLEKTIASNNQMALNMLSSMSEHRRQQSREIEHLNVQNAPQRIGCFLLRLCPAKPPESIILNLPYDKTLIASRLGMKPETFSRALAKLKTETGINIKGPTVEINHLQSLVSYTCNHCSSSFPCEDLQE